ncbi:MAG: hypothetical protein LBE78_11990 [Burkholderiaceae bacterium]|nr:hypothetical protein [Burkholderiaceae bacterium]
MNIDFSSFGNLHLLGESATRPSVPRSPRHAALLVLAGISPPRPRALPDLAVTALTGAFNRHFQGRP